MKNFEIFKQAKEMQKKFNNSVVKVKYKNYKGLSIEVEPVDLALVKTSLNFLSMNSNFNSNVRAKYGK